MLGLFIGLIIGIVATFVTLICVGIKNYDELD